MRILHLLPRLSHLGGVEKHVLDLLHHFPDHYVAASGGCLSDALGGRFISGAFYSKNPWQIGANRCLLKRIIKNKKIDAIHVHSRAPAWSVVGLNIPWISTFHGIYGCQNIFKKYYNAGMLRGQKVIAISDFVASHIKKTYNSFPEITTIYEGIDTDHFSPQDVLAENLWGIKKKVILMVARFTALKGHEILIRATQDLDAAVVFIGDQTRKPAYVQGLRQLAKDLCHDHVYFMPEMQDPRPAYAAAHSVVSCSVEPETFGRTTAEALSMGKFFVGTNIGATPEICGNVGWLVPPKDVRALRETLSNLLFRPPAMRQEARKRMISYFSDTKMYQNLHHAYRDLVS